MTSRLLDEPFPHPPTGDSHNFGRRVAAGPSGRIEKPRCIEWERLFLGDSSLRKVLAGIFRTSGAPDPFELIPTLNFLRTDGKDFSGSVERLQWRPKSLKITETICAQIGALIGLTSWFGMGDLHRQNIAFGSLLDGRPVCAPLDIECLFVDHQLPAQSRLIGYAKDAGPRCGLAEFQELIAEAGHPGPFVAAVVHGYIGAMAALTEQERAVASALIEEPGISRWPIRTILRDTSEYLSLLDGSVRPEAVTPNLLPSEISQLARGDVPYFYREAASQEHRWLTSDSRDWAAASSTVALDSASFPSLGIMRALGANGRVAWLNRETLLGAGALQVARMLSGTGRGEASFSAAKISITDERIAVSWGNDRRHRWACAR